MGNNRFQLVPFQKDESEVFSKGGWKPKKVKWQGKTLAFAKGLGKEKNNIILSLKKPSKQNTLEVRMLWMQCSTRCKWQPKLRKGWGKSAWTSEIPLKFDQIYKVTMRKGLKTFLISGDQWQAGAALLGMTFSFTIAAPWRCKGCNCGRRHRFLGRDHDGF